MYYTLIVIFSLFIEWSSLLSLDNSTNDTQLLSTCLIQLITHLAYVLVAMETQMLTNLVSLYIFYIYMYLYVIFRFTSLSHV